MSPRLHCWWESTAAPEDVSFISRAAFRKSESVRTVASSEKKSGNLKLPCFLGVPVVIFRQVRQATTAAAAGFPVQGSIAEAAGPAGGTRKALTIQSVDTLA